uniref:Lipase_3 domain-containing protein n=1 Tax=Parastrongyloides trichosuri TaxID=131310 RepID=A0A0N4ZSM9_PARTI
MSFYSKNSSPTVTNTNILSLMNTLYKSGFAMQSPTSPNLDSRTMHTLYAFSFIIYSTNCCVDWLHVYCVLRGHITSFPLETWVVIVLTTSVVAGTMLTALLMMLCVENAFAQRVHVSPYRSGFAIICEALIEWIQAFNNFRVAYLVVILHDLPVTCINFFFLTSCRCSGPDTWKWSLLLSSLTSFLSLSWRLVMLYFAYNNLICGNKKVKKNSLPLKKWTPISYFNGLVKSCVDDQRLREFDETWPIRFSISKIYYKEIRNESKKVVYWRTRLDEIHEGCFEKFKTCLGNITGYTVIYTKSFILHTIKFLACLLLATFFYLTYAIILFIPLLNHYCCTKNSLSHRHRCSKTFVKMCTFFYHYLSLAFSLLLSVALLVMNLSLLISPHAIGSSTAIPEISQFCLEVNITEKTIQPIFKPSHANWYFWFTDKDSLKEDDSIICKSVYENNESKLGLFRNLAGPWQARLLTNDGILTISTILESNYADRQNPRHTMSFDYGLIQIKENESTCLRKETSGWKFRQSFNELGWPFFVACKNTISLSPRYLIKGAICK